MSSEFGIYLREYDREPRETELFLDSAAMGWLFRTL